MKIKEFPFPIPNLPTFVPDETLYSWCGSVHAWNCNASVLQTSRQLFDHPYSGLLHDFPAYLNTLNERTFGLIPAPTDIALQHTLLGYFLPFQKKEVAEQILEKICERSYPQLKYKLGIPASGIGNYHPLKFCAECLDNDLRSYGRSVWHIQHQRPSSMICALHIRPLIYVKPKTTPVHLRYWVDPQLAIGVSMPTISNDQQLSRLLKLATFSDHVHGIAPGALDAQILAWTYQGRLKDEKLLTARGNVRTGRLCELVSDYYTHCDDLPGFQVLQSLSLSTSGFIGTISRKRPKQAHPFKHLLLMTILFESWDDLVSSYRKVEQNTPEWIAPEIKEEAGPDPRMQTFVHLTGEEGLSICAAASQIGISTTTGTQWAKQHGLPYTSRTKHLTPEKLKEVEDLLIKGAIKKDIALSTGVSVVSINRLLAANTKLKEQWIQARQDIDKSQHRRAFLKTIQSNPSLPVKLIRKIPGNGYQWLYRYDREWLIEHLPSLWNP